MLIPRNLSIVPFSIEMNFLGSYLRKRIKTIILADELAMMIQSLTWTIRIIQSLRRVHRSMFDIARSWWTSNCLSISYQLWEACFNSWRLLLSSMMYFLWLDSSSCGSVPSGSSIQMSISNPAYGNQAQNQLTWNSTNEYEPLQEKVEH